MMTVIGLGSDLLRIERIVRMGERNGDLLLQRLLAPSEQRPGPPDWRRVASFVACKEAFFKALGTGLVRPLRWVDVAVSGTDHAPTLHLTATAAAAFCALGGLTCRLTLCSNEIFILATVILIGRAGASDETGLSLGAPLSLGAITHE